MENTLSWILVADACQARIYAVHKAMLLQRADKNLLKLIKSFEHADSRKKSRELVTDKQGEFGSGTFVESTSPKTREAEEFAQELLNFLEDERKLNVYRDLILIAPPAFMGHLKSHMNDKVKKLLIQTIEKDYTHISEQELVQNLMTFL